MFLLSTEAKGAKSKELKTIWVNALRKSLAAKGLQKVIGIFDYQVLPSED